MIQSRAPIRACSLEGCSNVHFSRGWCRAHYEQARRGKQPAILSEYTAEESACAAEDCTVAFRQRSRGSKRLYCSRRCRDRTEKAAMRARGDYVPLHRRPGRAECSVSGCDRPKYVSDLCSMHYERLRTQGDVGGAGPRRAARGEAPWRRNADGYMRRSLNGVIELQHRVVMENHLGRHLWPDETVHHRNGQRDDNRIENLELWSSWQPSGQHVTDKIAWAREILARYADLPPDV